MSTRFVGVVIAQGVLALGLALPDNIGRGAATVLFLLGAPAVAVAAALRTTDPLARVVVAAAAAVVVNALVAEIMLVTGSWSAHGGLLAVGVVSLVLAVATGAVGSDP